MQEEGALFSLFILPFLLFPLFHFSFCSKFIFPLQFTFNIILYDFWVDSIVVRKSYTLQSVPPIISSTHLAPHIVVTKLLTIFPTSSSSLSGPMHRQKFSEYLLCV